jgi:tetratricopeptide (TPR) repeat protein
MGDMKRFVLLAAVMASMAVLCASRSLFAQTSDPSATEAEQQGAADRPDASGRQDAERKQERQTEMSSSKDTRVDLSPPADDAKQHPQSGTAVKDAEDDTTDVQELHNWDPHKAAKDVEVGDFYYKKKNYRAALDRYKEALVYKPNDAMATYRLAECQERTGNSAEAAARYEDYLKILPHGPFAEDAQKALERLRAAK